MSKNSSKQLVEQMKVWTSWLRYRDRKDQKPKK